MTDNRDCHFPATLLGRFEGPFGLGHIASGSHPLTDLTDLQTRRDATHESEQAQEEDGWMRDPAAVFDQFKREHHRSNRTPAAQRCKKAPTAAAQTTLKVVKASLASLETQEDRGLTQNESSAFFLFDGCSDDNLHGSASSATSNASRVHASDGNSVLAAWNTRDEEIFTHGRTVVWSAAGVVRKSFTVEQPVLQALWATFVLQTSRFTSETDASTAATDEQIDPQGHQTRCHPRSIELPVRCLCILQPKQIDIYSNDGQSFTVALSRPVLRMHALKVGLLLLCSKASASPPAQTATLFSLLHPLSSFSPVQKSSSPTAPEIPSLFSDPQESVAATSELLDLCVTVNEETGATIWRIGKAYPFVEHKSEVRLSALKVLPLPRHSLVKGVVFCPLASNTVAIYFHFAESTHAAAGSLCGLVATLSASPSTSDSFSDDCIISNVAAALPVTSTILPHPAHTVTFGSRRFSSLVCSDLLVLDHSGKLSLWSGAQFVARVSCQHPAGSSFPTIESISHPVGSRFSVTFRSHSSGDGGLRKPETETFRAALPSTLRVPSFVASCMYSLGAALPFPDLVKLLVGYLSPFYDSLAAGREPTTPRDRWFQFAEHVFPPLFGGCTPISVASHAPASTNSSSWARLLESHTAQQFEASILGPLQPLYSASAPRQSNGLWARFAPSSKQEHATDRQRYSLWLLHLLYENLKLDGSFQSALEPMAESLLFVAHGFGWRHFELRYLLDFPSLKDCLASAPRDQLALRESDAAFAGVSKPPCVTLSLSHALEQESDAPLEALEQSLMLICDASNALGNARHLVFAPELWLHRTLSMVDVFRAFLAEMRRAPQSFFSGLNWRSVIANIARKGITSVDVDSFALGLMTFFRYCTSAARPFAEADWPVEALVFVGRRDLLLQVGYLDDTALYKSDKLRQQDSADNPIHAFELLSQANYTARFPDDHRLVEALRLLQNSEPVRVKVEQKPDMNDHDLLEDQYFRLLVVTQRTLAIAVGKGMLTLASSPPALSPFVPQYINLNGKIPPSSTVIAPSKATKPTDQQLLWPRFHNGVATGLEVQPKSSASMQSNWIYFSQQRDAEEVATHAGFLLACGLNGHLAAVSSLKLYDFLSRAHDATSVAILIGMSAARRGTMDSSVTRMISLHFPPLLPRASTDLEHPTIVQTAAAFGLGLLYQRTGNRRIVDVLLNEILATRRGLDATEIDSYSLASGLALGMVLLERGSVLEPAAAAEEGEAPSPSVNDDITNAMLLDLKVEDRLFNAIDGYPKAERSLFSSSVGFVNLQSLEGKGLGIASRTSSAFSKGAREGHPFVPPVGTEFDKIEKDRSVRYIPQHLRAINPSVTAPGALLALSLMYLKTNNWSIASRIKLPETSYALDLAQSDLLLFRVLARSLIMWDSVEPTVEWVTGSLPATLREKVAKVNVLFASAPAPFSSGVEVPKEHPTTPEDERSARPPVHFQDSDSGGETPPIPAAQLKKKKTAIEELLDKAQRDERERERRRQEQLLSVSAENALAGDTGALVNAQCYMITGACMAIGIKYAGSANPLAFDCLIRYAKLFESLVDTSSALDKVNATTYRVCHLSVLLSLSAVMAGTGNVDVLRLLRKIHVQCSSDINYGMHMASHMAIGMLFLGGGLWSFGTSAESVAGLLCALHPRFPLFANDNRFHLQALRHMYVLACEPRVVEARDTEASVLRSVPIQVHVDASFLRSSTASSTERESGHEPARILHLTTPAVLPELRSITRIEVMDPKYYRNTLDLSAKGSLSAFRQSMVLFLQSRRGEASLPPGPAGSPRTGSTPPLLNLASVSLAPFSNLTTLDLSNFASLSLSASTPSEHSALFSSATRMAAHYDASALSAPGLLERVEADARAVVPFVLSASSLADLPDLGPALLAVYTLLRDLPQSHGTQHLVSLRLLVAELRLFSRVSHLPAELAPTIEARISGLLAPPPEGARAVQVLDDFVRGGGGGGDSLLGAVATRAFAALAALLAFHGSVLRAESTPTGSHAERLDRARQLVSLAVSSQTSGAGASGYL